MNLTKDEILKLEATRETDALIAEEVLRLEKTNVTGWYWQDGMYDELPYYSSDDSDALLILDKFLDAHLNYATNIESVNITGGRIWDVLLWGMDDDPIFSAKAPTLSLAICRVLLLAILEDK